MIHGIEIRDHAVTQAQKIFRHVAHIRTIAPRLAHIELIDGAVQTADRRKGSPLHPASIQLIILNTLHVTADIMAPPCIADIIRSRGEIRLEIQRLPRNVGVSGEAHGIPMGAGARIAREGQRAQTVPGGIHKMEMIQHPQGIQPLHARLLALLPVQPPEVHALLLHGMQHILKVVVHEFR